MSGLQDLSDDDLKALYAQQQAGGNATQPSGIKALSDDDLKALYAKQQPTQSDDTFGEPAPWAGLENRMPEAESLKMASDYKGPSHAMKPGTDYSLQSMASGAPVLGALVPQTPELKAWEEAHPGKTLAMHAAGGVMGTLPAVMAAPELFGAGAGEALTERAAMGAASSGGLQFADSMARGKSPEQAMNDAKKSAAFSMIATPAASVLSEGVAPTLQRGAQTLIDKGVKLTPGQMLGGTPQRLESVAESAPIMGVGVRDARIRSIESFNRAAENEALQPIGQTVPEHIEPGYEGRQYVGKAINNAYRDAYSNAAMSVTPQFVQDVAAVTQNAATGRLLAQPEMDQLNSVVQHKIAGKFRAAQGPLNGEQINDIDSSLRQLAADYGKEPSPEKRRLGGAIADLRTAFNNHFAAQNPQAAQQVAAADRAYTNYVRLRDAGASTAVQGMEGQMTPTQLAQAAKSQDQSFGKRAMSEGRAPYQQLAQAGKTILPSKIPDSGTPERIETMVLGETALMDPLAAIALAAPLAAGRVGYSTPMQDLARALIQAGPSRQMAADLVRRYGPQATNSLRPQRRDDQLARALAGQATREDDGRTALLRGLLASRE